MDVQLQQEDGEAGISQLEDMSQTGSQGNSPDMPERTESCRAQIQCKRKLDLIRYLYHIQKRSKAANSLFKY